MESTEDAIEIEDAEERGATAPTAPAGNSGLIHRLFGGYAELLRIPACGALHRWVGGRVHAARHDQHVHYHRRAADLRQLHDRRRALGRLLRLVRAARPQLGKLADRFGQRAASIPAIIIWVIASQVFIAAATAHVDEWILFCIVPFLAFTPPWGAMSRTRWRYLLRGDEKKISTSLSLCSAFDECMWVIGNPLSSTLAVISAALAIRFGAVCAVIGAIMVLTEVTTLPPSQSQLTRHGCAERREVAPVGGVLDAGADAATGRRRLQARGRANPVTRPQSIWGPGMVALCAVYFGLGAFQNATSVSIVAFAREVGMPQVSGLVISCFSFSSLVGALFSGAIRWKTPLWRRFYTCLVVLCCGLSLFVLAPSLWVIGAIYLAAGLCQAPDFRQRQRDRDAPGVAHALYRGCRVDGDPLRHRLVVRLCHRRAVHRRVRAHRWVRDRRRPRRRDARHRARRSQAN